MDLRLNDEVGWRAFGVWALCGALWTIPWLSFGPGVVTLPLAGVLTWALGRHAPRLNDIWGLVAGIGALVALSSLGNLESRGWLIGGLAMTVVALVVYITNSRREVVARGTQNS